MTVLLPKPGLIAPVLETAPVAAPGREALPAVVSPGGLLAAMRRRYAVKRFDSERRIPGPFWDALEESLRLTASSYGLQPWKFFAVDDPALREKLRTASYGQAQVVEADRYLVFAVRTAFTEADIDRFVACVAETRKVSQASLAGFRRMMLELLERTPEEREAWAGRQAYIALGNFLTSAAVLGVDACPMEGFEPKEYDRILALAPKGYTALVAVAAGYRSAADAHAERPKARFPRAEVIEHL